MLKKTLSIVFIIILCLLCVIFLAPHDKTYKVLEVKSPIHLVLDNGDFKLNNFDTFDFNYTEHNKILANKLGISEKETFVLGNLGKDYFDNLLKGRSVYIKENDLIYYRYGYKDRFFYSGFCIKDFEPCSQDAFEHQLKSIRRANYKILDIDTENIYELDDDRIKDLKNFILIRKAHIQKENKKDTSGFTPQQVLKTKDLTIYLSDMTTNLKPDRNCSDEICKEILFKINNSNKSIDMAIYGYSRVPKIEKALKDALDRGVKIRLVYDLNSKGNNIYDDTDLISKLITNNMSDRNSVEVDNIMHNKFYIFDDKVLITGSANLSHTDMSGFNSNSIVVINSETVAKIYKQEFEQMYAGKFHNQKEKFEKEETNFKIYFSPKDKSITNAVLPLIKGAKKYIYIPTFVLTEKRVTKELINAKKRGVDVKIIIDALNASNKYSKHQILRDNGIQVKTENYAGKMHSKSMIVDDEYVLIGSMNFSFSGENKNDENLIVIKDELAAKFYKNFFLYQWNKIDNKWLKFNAKAESKDSIGSCEDGIDNNYDNLTDTDDPACR